MEKQKRWQFWLIVTVTLLTLYNILPTLFYYTKPLHEPINNERAYTVATEIASRVNTLEPEAIDWLYSFSKLLGVKPKAITLNEQDPKLISVTFQNGEEADRFRRFLPNAGKMIPFVPAQLELYSGESDKESVLVARQIGVRMNEADLKKLFKFIPKMNEKGSYSQGYLDLVYDRAETLALGFGGTSEFTAILEAASEQKGQNAEEAIQNISEQLVQNDRLLQRMPSLAKRYYSHLLQGSKSGALTQWQGQIDNIKTRLLAKKEKAKGEELAQIDRSLKTLDKAKEILKKNEGDIKASTTVLTQAEVKKSLQSAKNLREPIILSLKNANPFVEALVIDLDSDLISLKFYNDIELARLKEVKSETEAYTQEELNRLLYNEIVTVSRETDEEIQPNDNQFAVKLSSLPDAQSFLAMELGGIAEKQSESLLTQLKNNWLPTHPELSSNAYPVRTFDSFKNEPADAQKLGLVIYAPSMSDAETPKGFRKGSIYVIARNLSLILDKAKTSENKALNEALSQDLEGLKNILTQNGFIGYSGSSYGIDKAYSKDYIFELDDYYSNLLKATREGFTVKGNKKQAILPFTDVEQRIIAKNRIDDKIQEDLLKWKEEYSTAQVDLDPIAKYYIPQPTQNPFWTNFVLSFKKYFRGDDRKILKWGLDLSGGKSVRIGLRDKNNQPVTNPDDVKQAVNELYTRINKMGVSERTIRIENNNIILEFPGSQALSADELVKASTMTFHVVNEKFGNLNRELRGTVNQFLQEVWNEAVVTNRKSVEQINEIAWQRLGGTFYGDMQSRPVSDAAKILIENGLKLANPRDAKTSNQFNDEISSIAVLRGDDFSQWEGQTHPLLFVFNNYALEGSSLTNIQVGYDATEGNHLGFSVKRSYEGSNAQQGSPRDDFYTWTSHFSEDKIAGTNKEVYSGGHGWRMAVILNGTVISKPVLRAALRDNASISGRFTQREVSQLAADLKAGSLSFTPKILSEQNVSAELGAEERTKGIVASLVAIALVAVAMIGYYRFAGVVATVAVLFNILIMWGVLQNLDAAMTLPGIAGIVLTIGMAVDANVLVFERIREEFAISGRISSAIQAGYRKAFSAIFDSNITTIMAALILIQFDSGPIKGFAVTLIIGIFSSMFTALFMTRYFFAGWVQNPKNKELKMSHWISNTNFDFLSKAKPAIVISLIVMILGSYMLYNERKTIFGMDFTGGYSLNVEVENQPGDVNYRLMALDALQKAGASATDVEVRELTLPNQLRLRIGAGMDEQGHPFYGMPDRVDGNFTFNYQNIPRIDWTVKALEAGGLKISDFEKERIGDNWAVVSGQLSDAMRNNAIIGLAIALAAILLYITFRFEFKYAVGAVVALVHDVIITLGILAFLHAMGLPVTIDLTVVGAIMTIIGYSLNDTIIVFDRIREDLKILKRLSFKDAVNHALNVTLSRTLMTSGTTLLVLLALVLLGGSTIFAFSLVMTIGVLIGTLSSLFIASPVMMWMHEREEKQAELANKHS